MPTPAWFDRRTSLEVQCERAVGAYRYTNGKGGISATPRKGYHRSPKHPYDAATGTGGCGLAIPGTTWTVGDNINAAVGQGDVGISPLQLGMVYSAIENGGTIVHPHLGQDIQSPDGTVLQRLSSPPLRRLHINPTYLADDPDRIARGRAELRGHLRRRDGRASESPSTERPAPPSTS